LESSISLFLVSHTTTGQAYGVEIAINILTF